MSRCSNCGATGWRNECAAGRCKGPCRHGFASFMYGDCRCANTYQNAMRNLADAFDGMANAFRDGAMSYINKHKKNDDKADKE